MQYGAEKSASGQGEVGGFGRRGEEDPLDRGSGPVTNPANSELC